MWVLQVWEKLGKPEKFRLLELGPGKGTLMHDVLRVSSDLRRTAEAPLVWRCSDPSDDGSPQCLRLCLCLFLCASVPHSAA